LAWLFSVWGDWLEFALETDHIKELRKDASWVLLKGRSVEDM
jgi:hypothetical protein